MKKSIWKFPLDVISYQKISMPINAKILSVQSQNGLPVIWAICNTESEYKEDREFEIVGTGEPFFEDSRFWKEQKYIGTFQLLEGEFVGHLFELIK